MLMAHLADFYIFKFLVVTLSLLCICEIMMLYAASVSRLTPEHHVDLMFVYIDCSNLFPFRLLVEDVAETGAFSSKPCQLKISIYVFLLCLYVNI